MDIYEIIRRWHNKQNNTHIADVLEYDRKTVRKYIQFAKDNGITTEAPLPSKKIVIELFNKMPRDNKRKKAAQNIFKPYLQEITELITDKKIPLKMKSAFEIICQRHDLDNKVSYTSFTRFVKANHILLKKDKSTCRIEVEAGSEVQIDYAKMGIVFDPLTNKNKTVYAFIATLSHSRHKFVDFVYKQNQQSFVASHVRMFDFFNGAPLRLVIDNLKSGIIKTDLYNPQFNRAYREMAEHYDCFIDPCRVRKPQDKGKVERDVQTIREQFNKMRTLNPKLDIRSANLQIKKWLISEYGQKEHGTTGLKPYEVFIQNEQPKLKSLPAQIFEIPEWKEAIVHADHYIQFNKKFYSVPHAYVGKKVWIRGTEKIIEIFYDYKLIKQHAVSSHFRTTDFNDFPENVKAYLDKGLAEFLQSKAETVGPDFKKLIRTILEVHAFINLRKAQGLISLMDKWEHSLIEKAACFALEHNIQLNPKSFIKILNQLQQHNMKEQFTVSISQQTMDFVRDMKYFLNN